MELDKLAVGCEALIGPCPDAAAAGMNFAVSVEAASAGPVARVLRALRLRAEKGQVLNAAVTAVLAAQNHSFASCLQTVHQFQKQGMGLNASSPFCKMTPVSAFKGKKTRRAAF